MLLGALADDARDLLLVTDRNLVATLSGCLIQAMRPRA